MNNEHISRVYLLNVPLENDYKNTIHFNKKSEQESYFQSRKRVVFDTTTNTMSYQRKDGVIKVNQDLDSLLSMGVNYVMYQNKAFSNKWFYAFITDMKYINSDLTEVKIETDVMQTWYFDFKVKPSFVEREHVSNDAVGNHTVPENLETGEYLVMQHLSDSYNKNMVMVLGATLTPGEMIPATGGNYNGIPSGIKYYRINNIDDLSDILEAYSDGHADAINSLFIAPTYLAGGDNVNAYFTPDSAPATFDLGISKIKNLNGYVPRHHKLLTYPFCYIRISNGVGGSAIYQQELWKANSDGEMIFKVSGVLTPGCSIRGVPIEYKNDGVNFDEGVTLGKFPQLNWTTDQYTNWLTQNGVNLAISGGSGVASLLVGALTGNVAAIGGGALAIGHTLSQVYQHSFTPPQASGNMNSGDVTTAMGANRFHCYKMAIKPEYARIIDDYFHMFGYKVNRVKEPNKCHRSRWWYTKTIDVNIDGAIPNNDMQKIKDCYNKGITFWRNADEIQKYNLSNGIAITSGAITD